MGLQLLSAPSVLSLIPPLGSPCSVLWLVVSNHICIAQVLVEPLRRQTYQAPVNKHFLAPAIVLGFGVCRWDVSLDGAVSAPLFVPVFPFDRNNSGLKYLRWVTSLIPQLRTVLIYWSWSLQVLPHVCCAFPLKSSLLGPGNHLLPWLLAPSFA